MSLDELQATNPAIGRWVEARDLLDPSPTWAVDALPLSERPAPAAGQRSAVAPRIVGRHVRLVWPPYDWAKDGE